MKKFRQLIGLSVCLCLGVAAPARADVVTDWNDIAIKAIVASMPPAGGSPFLYIAMVHLAMHDAVAAFDGQFRPYYREIRGASGSPVAAAAKSANDVLVNLFPSQTVPLSMTYATYLATKGLAADNPGVAIGQQAAAGIIQARANDGRFPASYPDFTGGTGIGVWRPTPPAFAPMATPWLAHVTPFAFTDPAKFLPKAPPALTSSQYARDYNEVKQLGSLTSSTRTAEQTDLAHFWNANYLVMWNEVAKNLASAQRLKIGESARLFALLNMAMADAGITAWNTKLHYVFWRPSTAIQNGNNDDNPNTAGDAIWQPLIPNPPYPDYTSGANNVTGAATRMLRLFFGGDRMNFSVTTTNTVAVQKTRMFRHFSDAADEVVVARIYEGIHFRFADSEGRSQGQSVAKWGFKHFLRPVHDNDRGDDDDDDDDDKDR
jgi:hypothetical protein